MQEDWQHDIRARVRARSAGTTQKRWYQRVRYWALGLALVLHLGLLVGLRDAMHIPMQPQSSEIQVVFLKSPPPPPMPQPQPFPKRTRATTSANRVAQMAAPVASAQSTPATPRPAITPQLDLFNRNGTIWQPSRPIAAAPTPQERAEELLQRGHNILHCRATRFTRTYRYDESLGDRIARKYLVWVGLYGQAPRERLQRHLREATEACDAQ